MGIDLAAPTQSAIIVENPYKYIAITSNKEDRLTAKNGLIRIIPTLGKWTGDLSNVLFQKPWFGYNHLRVCSEYCVLHVA